MEAGSEADGIDPAMAARQLAELTIPKDAEKARAVAQLAEPTIQKAQADAVEAIIAEKARAGAAIAYDHAFPKPRRFNNISMAEASGGVLKVGSPSKEGGGVLYKDLAVFTLDANPLVLSLAALAQTRSLEALSDTTHDPASLLNERNVYPFLTSYLPTWVPKQHRPAHGMKGGLSVNKVFICDGIPPILPRMFLPWTCRPEVLTSAILFHPAFNAKANSATSAANVRSFQLYDELVTHVTLGIVGSMFVAVPERRRRFFTRPPVGYGLAALAHVGYLIAVEWVGRLFVSVVSQPFFLGSPEHQAAVAALPDYDYAHSYEDISFDGVPVLACRHHFCAHTCCSGRGRCASRCHGLKGATLNLLTWQMVGVPSSLWHERSCGLRSMACSTLTCARRISALQRTTARTWWTMMTWTCASH
jgi:hypothetical protein